MVYSSGGFSWARAGWERGLIHTTGRGTCAVILLAAAIATVLPWNEGQAQSQPGGEAQTPVQKDNAESTAKPDDVQTPEANPSRPTITNPAHIPPVGYIQFEQGFVQANGSPDGLDRQFSLNQTTRLSLHPRLMVQLLSQPYALSRMPDPGNASTIESDPGDLTFGVQGVAIKEAGRRPAIAFGYLRRVRAGSAPDLDIGSYVQSGVMLVSGDLGGFHYDTNFSVSEQESGRVRRAQLGQTLSVTHDLFPQRLNDKLELTGEIWHYTQPRVTIDNNGRPLMSSNAAGALWTLGYSARPNLVLDCGFDHGLTSTSTEWQGFAGFTYLLPHRLWPHKDEAAKPGVKKHIHRR